jgi:hypothetical protein
MSRVAPYRTYQHESAELAAFNHAQFYGANSVNGNVASLAFGRVKQAASPVEMCGKE